MRPAEFWESTPAEVCQLSLGYSDRIYETLEGYSILASWIINHSGFASKSVRPSNLLRPRGGKVKTDGDVQTKEDVQRILDEAARYHKTKAWTKLSDKYAKKEGDE